MQILKRELFVPPRGARKYDDSVLGSDDNIPMRFVFCRFHRDHELQHDGCIFWGMSLADYDE
jgi:hypothetical protein